MVFSSVLRTTQRFGTLALSASLLWAGAVQAQVGISPLVIELDSQRGQAQGMVSVVNNTDKEFRARIYAEPFTYMKDEGFQTLPESPNDLRPYLQFSPRELAVPPGVTRRVRFTARLAPNLPDGEYRTILFTESLRESTPGDSNASAVGIKARVGTTVYVRKGNVSSNLAVGSANWDSSENKIALLVSKRGKASARPSVTWNLKQGDKVVKTGTVDSTTVIAEGDRNISIYSPGEGETPLASGSYQLSGELAWGPQRQQQTMPFNVNLTIPAQSVPAPSR